MQPFFHCAPCSLLLCPRHYPLFGLHRRTGGQHIFSPTRVRVLRCPTLFLYLSPIGKCRVSVLFLPRRIFTAPPPRVFDARARPLYDSLLRWSRSDIGIGGDDDDLRLHLRARARTRASFAKCCSSFPRFSPIGPNGGRRRRWPVASSHPIVEQT